MRKVLIAALLATASQAATPGQIRQSITRAVKLIQASQHEWDEGWSCASCHHQYLPAIAYEAVRAQKLPLDEAIAKTDGDMAFRGLSDLDAAVQGSNAIEPSIGDAYRLWAAEATGLPTNLAIQAEIRRMAGRQQPDGHWSTMDERPPQSNSPFTVTSLAIRSLYHADQPKQPELAQRIRRGREWLISHTPVDTEGWTFRLLGLGTGWSGVIGSDPAAKRALLKLQQSDGGWNSMAGRPSDAYSTGEALYALLESAELKAEEPSCQRAIAFLLSTQQEDGSWRVPSRLHPPAPLSPEYFESGYPYEHDQYLSIMGATWAVLALTRSDGVARRVYRYGELPLPWAETALFGTATSLGHLLVSGFDPNTSTPAGTTALMMAVPDAAKAKLLLDHGADPTTRAKSKYSALDIAAQYRDSIPTIRLLLEKGARPSTGADLHAPHTMVLAAATGHVEALRLLKDAGASVDEPAILGSVLYATPLIIASMNGHTETVRILLALGANINQPDAEGLTALMWATLANRQEVVRLLLARHADPNLKDRNGMTALRYTSSVEYADPTVKNLLSAH